MDLAGRIRYDRYELLIIDEFGLDKIERQESPVATSLMYKVIDSRRCRLSTILISNVDFEGWGSYLGDPPLAMAVLDRIVDNATVIKINGRSYPSAKAKKASAPTPAEE
jgi:DNA replication protein DnaC